VSHFEKIVPAFEPILLSEMNSVRLQNRTDTKFIFPQRILPAVLSGLLEHYRLMDINGVRNQHYHSIYFDTKNFKFFNDHHNGRGTRQKIRMRKYLDSDLSFFEIKLKNNKGRTDKQRIVIPDIGHILPNDAIELVENWMPHINHEDLIPVMHSEFHRMTFVAKTIPERMTIDTGLVYRLKDKSKALKNLVVAELKQSVFNPRSPFFRELRKWSVRPTGMSKYCIGCLYLHDSLRHNNFKTRLIKIQKIENGLSTSGNI